jgi:co-chaperonin GroES (HSP10)
MSTRIQEIKKKIALLSAELHREYHTEYAEWNPKFPWLLVYVLPREQRIGNLWVPGDTKGQNKVTLEGVVVKLWKADHLNIKSSLKIGDHVLFPHYSGQPFANRSKDDFRVIKEGFSNIVDSEIVDSGHIFAKVEYSQYDLMKEFWDTYEHTLSIKSWSKKFELLSRNFVIYPKESKTLSGK